jgi:DNA-directed RNA polymerase specialized sigma24 family protein
MYPITGRSEEAEELAQEAMARVFERWDRIRSFESPGGYEYRTALNLNRQRLRHLALNLVEWVGLTSEETAGVLGIEASSVRSRIHGARAAVRQRLEEPSD